MLRDLRARGRQITAFAYGVAAALIALLLYTWLLLEPLTLIQVQATIAQTMASATPPPAYSARVYQVIQPSLVLIQTEGAKTNGDMNYGLGSGVVIDDRGTFSPVFMLCPTPLPFG